MQLLKLGECKTRDPLPFGWTLNHQLTDGCGESNWGVVGFAITAVMGIICRLETRPAFCVKPGSQRGAGKPGPSGMASISTMASLAWLSPALLQVCSVDL
jgi:hypothetical protein